MSSAVLDCHVGLGLRVRHDRTLGAFGEQGAGKTLDLLAPALLNHPGAALVTLTKLDDLLLTVGRRHRERPPGRGPRPVRPRPRAAGADLGSDRRLRRPAAGRAARESIRRRHRDRQRRRWTQRQRRPVLRRRDRKVLQGFFHAAALTGRTLEHVLEWVANPVAAEQPAEILRQHPHAARFWDGLLAWGVAPAHRTPSATPSPPCSRRWRCSSNPRSGPAASPAPAGPATDLADLIARQRHGLPAGP